MFPFDAILKRLIAIGGRCSRFSLRAYRFRCCTLSCLQEHVAEVGSHQIVCWDYQPQLEARVGDSRNYHFNVMKLNNFGNVFLEDLENCFPNLHAGPNLHLTLSTRLFNLHLYPQLKDHYALSALRFLQTINALTLKIHSTTALYW